MKSSRKLLHGLKNESDFSRVIEREFEDERDYA